MSVNPFGAEQLGYTAEELIGRPVQNLFHEADREAVQRNTAICLEQLGRAMLHVAKHGYPKPILEAKDINSIN